MWFVQYKINMLPVFDSEALSSTIFYSKTKFMFRILNVCSRHILNKIVKFGIDLTEIFNHKDEKLKIPFFSAGYGRQVLQHRSHPFSSFPASIICARETIRARSSKSFLGIKHLLRWRNNSFCLHFKKSLAKPGSFLFIFVLVIMQWQI